MSIALVEHIYNSKINSCIIPNLNNVSLSPTKMYNKFSVVGRVTCGKRFYSETIEDYYKACKLFSLYQDVVKYFGGGEVELICVSKEDYDIINFSKI